MAAKFEVRPLDDVFELVEIFSGQAFRYDTFATREEAEKAQQEQEAEELQASQFSDVIDNMMDTLRELFPKMSDGDLKTRIVESIS